VADAFPRARFVFRCAAVVNWLVTIGPLVAPSFVSQHAASAFGFEPPNFPTLVRIWAGMAFLFGFLFWEIASDLEAKRHLVKYAWIEKTITAVSITLGWLAGELHVALFVLIVFTDWLWIPLFLRYGYAARWPALQSTSSTP
jgi:hypothetical protein